MLVSFRFRYAINSIWHSVLWWIKDYLKFCKAIMSNKLKKLVIYSGLVRIWVHWGGNESLLSWGGKLIHTHPHLNAGQVNVFLSNEANDDGNEMRRQVNGKIAFHSSFPSNQCAVCWSMECPGDRHSPSAPPHAVLSSVSKQPLEWKLNTFIVFMEFPQFLFISTT